MYGFKQRMKVGKGRRASVQKGKYVGSDTELMKEERIGSCTLPFSLLDRYKSLGAG